MYIAQTTNNIVCIYLTTNGIVCIFRTINDLVRIYLTTNGIVYRYLTPGSSNAVKLSRFFDKVIEKKLKAGVTSPSTHTKTDNYFSAQERKRTYSPSRGYSGFSHID